MAEEALAIRPDEPATSRNLTLEEEWELMKRLEDEALRPIPMRVSSGRMYMGRALTPEEETAFLATPYSDPGAVRNLIAPPTAEQAAGAGSRVAAATRPPTISGLTSIYPEMERFAQMEAVRRDVDRGVPYKEAFEMNVSPEYWRGRGRPMSEAESARIGIAQGNLALRAAEQTAAQRAAAEKAASDAYRQDIGIVSKIEAERQKAEAGLLGEELPQSTLDDLFSRAYPAFERAQDYELAQAQARQKQGVQPPTAVAPPTPVAVPPMPAPSNIPRGTPKIGEIRKGYKFLGGNPASASNWQKVR